MSDVQVVPMGPRERGMVLQALRIGAPIRQAAPAAGIPYGTFAWWMSEGRNEQAARDNGLAANPGRDWHVELVHEVERAINEAAVASVVHINRAAANGRWQAAAWMLSRRFPEDWGPPEQRIRLGMLSEEDESPREGLLAQLEQMHQRSDYGVDEGDTEV